MGEGGLSRWSSQAPLGGINRILGCIQEEKHGCCGWDGEAGCEGRRSGSRAGELRSAGHEQGGRTPADLSLKVPPATVGVWRGLRGEEASGKVVAAVQAGEGGAFSLSLSDEGKEPSEGQEGQGGRPGFQPEWLIRGP